VSLQTFAFSVLTLLVGRQEGHPAFKTLEWRGAGVVMCPERGADLHMSQLMLLPLTVSCFSKIQIGFILLVSAHLGSPGQRAIKRVCVCVCADLRGRWFCRWPAAATLVRKNVASQTAVCPNQRRTASTNKLATPVPAWQLTCGHNEAGKLVLPGGTNGRGIVAKVGI